MKLNLEFKGSSDPFEGNRTLRLKTIPEGAQITSVRVVAYPKEFEGPIAIGNGANKWGVTKKSGEQPKKWIVADLHTRRKITQLTARSIINPASGTTVQVDVGGLWIRLADNGNLLTDEGGEEFEVDLSSALSIINIPPTNTVIIIAAIITEVRSEGTVIGAGAAP